MLTMLFLVAMLFVILFKEWRSSCDKVPKTGWESDPPWVTEGSGSYNTSTTPAYTQPPGTAGPYTKNQVFAT